MAHKLSRRDFLKAGVIGAGTAVLSGCKFPPRWVNLEPYVRPPEEQISGNATWYASACRMCPAGCGIIVRIMNGRALKIEGNPEHPLNQGKLCPVGQSGLQLLYHPDRLTGPIQQAQRGSRNYQAVPWTQAIQTLSSKLQAAGKGLAIVAGSGVGGSTYQLLAAIAKTTGGAAPVVFDLHTIMTGFRALSDSAQQAFGSAFVPLYAYDQADVVFSFGTDFLSVGPSPVYENLQFGGFRVRPKGLRGYLVSIEPRMSLVGAKADRWLPVKPGTEGMVAQGIAWLIGTQGLGSAEVAGRAKAYAYGVDINPILQAAEISFDNLAKLARIFAEAAHPVAITGGSLAGTDQAVSALAAVQALNVIAGNQVGSLGAASGSGNPTGFSIAYSNLQDVQSLISQMNSGAIQALLVVDANPVFDFPDKLGFQQALAKVPFVASLNPLVDETGVNADLILPVRTYLEDWGAQAGMTGSGAPFVTSQQPVVEPLYGASSVVDVLLAAVQGFRNAGSALPWSDHVAYLQSVFGQLPAGQDNLVNGSWERFQQHGGWWLTGAPVAGGTPAASPAATAPAAPLSAPKLQGSEQEYPYYLHLFQTSLIQNSNSAALPWLIGSPETMTSMSYRNWVEMHPDTVKKLGLSDGAIVKVTTPGGEIEAPVFTYPAIRPDTIAIPVGYGHSDLGRFAKNQGTNAIQLAGAQGTSDNSNLAWNSLRAKVTPTGQHIFLPLFGNQEGTTTGFFNKENPAL